MYIGVTNNLDERVGQHRAGEGGAFTRKYRVNTLVRVEEFQFVEEAIAREKELEGWRRSMKDALGRSTNPTRADLFELDATKGPSLRSG